jgi:hypothetical protein
MGVNGSSARVVAFYLREIDLNRRRLTVSAGLKNGF